jgi:hypothetical protein
LTDAFTLIGVNPIPLPTAAWKADKEAPIPMISPKIAITGSIAALAFAATPVAAVAATSQHASAPATQVDNSRDARGVRHADRTPDKSSVDRSSDSADR